MANDKDSQIETLEAALYAAPPKEFIGARDALVAALKSAGKATDAKAAKALRRPMVPVWLWNKLIADGDEDAVAAVDIASGLAHAIARGAEGKKDLAEHTTGLRAAANAIVRNARKLASVADVGFSNAQERELQDLVFALPWSESVRDTAGRGRLQTLPEAVDPLEAMRALAAGETLREEPARATAHTKQRVPDLAAANDDGDTKDDKAAAKAAREAMRAQLQAELDAANEWLATAEHTLRDVEKQQATAEQEMRHAEKLFAAARANAERAATATSKQQTEVDELRDRRDAAKAALADA